jgi:hypothetical protein
LEGQIVRNVEGHLHTQRISSGGEDLHFREFTEHTSGMISRVNHVGLKNMRMCMWCSFVGVRGYGRMR